MSESSTIFNCDLEIKDMKLLEEWITQLKNGERAEFSEDWEKGGAVFASTIKIYKATQCLGIMMDDWRIIGYWDPGLLLFFEELAAFIEGTIDVECAGYESQAKINFSEGSVEIEIGTMEYEEKEPQELAGKGHRKIPDDIKVIIAGDSL